MNTALAALRKVSFDWTAHIDQIWVDQPHEAEEFQAPIRAELEEQIEDLLERRTNASPLGVPLLGPAGSGKTHLLGFLRRRAVAEGAYFVLADMTDVGDFWDTVALGYLRSLQQKGADGCRQVDHWLDRIIRQFGQDVRKAHDLPAQRPPGLINRADELLAEVRAKHPAELQEHLDVMRGLVYFACDHAEVNDLGYKWLQGLSLDDEEITRFGFRQRAQTPSRIVRGISWLLSLTGPTVLALDQLDAIVAEHDLARGPLDAETGPESGSEQQRRSLAIIQGIASGLLELRDVTRRTLSVVSSLEATWKILDRQATVSMADRFSSKVLLKPGTGPEVFTALVAGRLRSVYEEFGFQPPYAAYPYAAGFFERYRDGTPRELLKACEVHRKACRKALEVSEAGPADTVSRPTPIPPIDWKSSISALVATELAKMSPRSLIEDESETDQDKVIEALCDALVLENPVPDSVHPHVDKDFMGTGTYDPLHARVRLVLTSDRERELHHSFRFLEKAHHTAFQTRLKAALTNSGVDRDLSFRGLTIVRTRAIPTGAATQKLMEELRDRGGRLVTPSDEELRMLMVIRALLGTKAEPERFEEWLAAERPVSSMLCFAKVVESLFEAVNSGPRSVRAQPEAPKPVLEPGVRTPPRSSGSTAESVDVPATAAPVTASAAPAAPMTPATVPRAVSGQPPVLTIGRRLVSGEQAEVVGIPLDRLPYHTCVFAGSGSGKTVFLKRVIEEAALLGIPSIVLDGANDLSRLGVPWPERPDGFSDEDDAKARAYQENSEVIVWTPGAPSGNPMRLNPLPDFTLQSGTPAEREEATRTAIEVATSSVGDMIIKQAGSTATKQLAILKGTLEHFAKRGGTIRDLVGLLREPPEEVTEPYEKGEKMARELSELLHAEIMNDQLIGGAGTPLDPSVLFRASQPGKTRVSVLSLLGLPGDDQKRRFVDQLASTLFSWIKKNPAPPGGILGLLVIDEAKDFVPSGMSVPGKENIKRLAAQARKYGLGLLFATQGPKSIDHSIVSNCSTLLGGKMSSPASIDALQQLLSDKGTAATDVGTLKRGTFYFGSGPDKPRKVATALCLSYHPSTPPSEAEVLASAKRSASVLGAATG